MMGNMTLREICSAAGVSRRTVQGYEKAGLVTPAARNKYGHLLYDEQGLERILHIRFLQELGFSMKEIVQFEQASAAEQRTMMQQRIRLLEERRQELADLVLRAKTYFELL